MDIKKHYSFKNVDGIVDSIEVSWSKAEWTKTAPIVPGFYWYRDEYTTIPMVVELDSDLYLFELPGAEETYTPEEMLRHNGEFWSEPLQVPQCQ